MKENTDKQRASLCRGAVLKYVLLPALEEVKIEEHIYI